MRKLIKYEFRKTWITKLILLGITAVLEAAFLLGLYLEKENTLAISTILLVLLTTGGLMVIGLESVLTLHRDMNTKQSYMLFMTPHSSYTILGAKVLEFGLSLLIGGAFYFALGTLDITLLLAKSGELNQIWQVIQDFLSNFTVQGRHIVINIRGIGATAFCLLAGWFGLVTKAYLAVVISTALLNGKRFNGLLSFVIFLLLSWLTNWASGQITVSIASTTLLLVVYGLVEIAFAVVMYVVTAVIMERKLSV